MSTQPIDVQVTNLTAAVKLLLGIVEKVLIAQAPEAVTVDDLNDLPDPPIGSDVLMLSIVRETNRKRRWIRNRLAEIKQVRDSLL